MFNIKRHNVNNYDYYNNDNSHIHFKKSVNSSSIAAWSVLCFTHVIDPYFFERTVIGESYLKIFNNFALPRISHLIESVNILEVREKLDSGVSERWVERRSAIDWLSHSLDL